MHDFGRFTREHLVKQLVDLRVLVAGLKVFLGVARIVQEIDRYRVVVNGLGGHVFNGVARLAAIAHRVEDHDFVTLIDQAADELPGIKLGAQAAARRKPVGDEQDLQTRASA